MVSFELGVGVYQLFPSSRSTTRVSHTICAISYRAYPIAQATEMEMQIQNAILPGPMALGERPHETRPIYQLTYEQGERKQILPTCWVSQPSMHAYYHSGRNVESEVLNALIPKKLMTCS